MNEASDEMKDGRFSIICTGVGPESVTFPPGTQIFPLDDALWEIVQVVAELNVVIGVGQTFDGLPTDDVCLSCHAERPRDLETLADPFPHDPECIVTKARALVEQRKAQPKITVKMVLDGKEITGEDTHA